jgi:dihydroneopterin aldolase
MSIKVFVKNLEVLARIGIHGHEQGMPQPVRVNVELETNAVPREDRLDEVLDYEAVATAVRAIVAEGHINLAETLAERIVAACLSDKRVLRVRVRVEKLHALAGAEAAGVEIERSRG